MKFLFLMDPLEEVLFEHDTTFSLMLESHKRGYEVYYVPKNGISLLDGKMYFHTIKVTPQKNKEIPFIKEMAICLSQDEIDALFIRPNPPFDEEYLTNTWLLDYLPKRIVAINSPNGIRSVNEKIFTAQFKQFTPPTLISCCKEEMILFILQYKEIIIKPVNAFGGQSIFHFKKDNDNINVAIETLSLGYRRPIMLQEYVKDAVNGDKRILLLDGKILGSILRVHGLNDHRNNLCVGGHFAPVKATSRDKKIVSTLRPHLKKHGLHFVGIDIIGDYLTEINVTSPTCLQEMNRAYNVHLEPQVIDFVVAKLDLS